MKISGISKFFLILIALVVVLWVVFVLTGPDIEDEYLADKGRIASNQIKNLEEQMERVVVSKDYQNGEHIYKGTLVLPTPCHDIKQEVIVRESYPEQVQINLTIIDSGGVCAQVLTDKMFEVKFQASTEAVVQGFLEGVPIELVVSATN